jgi:hypothetical protein
MVVPPRKKNMLPRNNFRTDGRTLDTCKNLIHANRAAIIDWCWKLNGHVISSDEEVVSGCQHRQ